MNETSNDLNQVGSVRAEFQIFLDETLDHNPFDIIISQASTDNAPYRFAVSLQDIIDSKIEELDANQMTDDEFGKFIKLVNYFSTISKALQKALLRSRMIHEIKDERESTFW